MIIINTVFQNQRCCQWKQKQIEKHKITSINKIHNCYRIIVYIWNSQRLEPGRVGVKIAVYKMILKGKTSPNKGQR